MPDVMHTMSSTIIGVTPSSMGAEEKRIALPLYVACNALL
jgi:hypothetical protein